MDDDSISNDSIHDSSFEDAQGHWDSHLNSTVPGSSLLNTMSSTTDQEQSEQGIAAAAAATTATVPPLPPPILSETICISSDDDSNGNEEQHQEEEEEEEEAMTSILSQEWLPPATSTPLSTVSTIDTVRVERDIENDLFHNIEQLVREFVNRPNRQYPYYRVIRWTVGERPKMEHLITVVINRPTTIQP